VAADLATFHDLYPTVTKVVGNWEGILSNSGQTVELVDRSGKRVDAVRYLVDIRSRGNRLVGNGADLHYEGDDPTPYRRNYFKQTNSSEEGWTDLIELTRVLDTEPDETYADAVRRVADVEEWMLYFALETFVDNRETNLGNGNNGDGKGVDYFLSRGKEDSRFKVIPYDLDTILNMGDLRGNISDGLFRMNASRGANHVSFKLDADGEAIGLFTALGAQIDAVAFGPQSQGGSEGRFPDGSDQIVRFPQTSSPAAPNYLPPEPDSDGDSMPDIWEMAIEVPVLGASGWVEVSDLLQTIGPRRFYRALLGPQPFP